jgi:hypothetical protein
MCYSYDVIKPSGFSIPMLAQLALPIWDKRQKKDTIKTLALISSKSVPPKVFDIWYILSKISLSPEKRLMAPPILDATNANIFYFASKFI